MNCGLRHFGNDVTQLSRSAISNSSHSKPVLPLSNEQGSQVKDQGPTCIIQTILTTASAKCRVLEYWDPEDVGSKDPKRNYTQTHMTS
jgi:hypothetical protein